MPPEAGIAVYVRGRTYMRSSTKRPLASRSGAIATGNKTGPASDPNDADRIWAVFDWDEEGWKSFVSDPSVPPIMQQAGHKGRPQTASFDVHLDA